MTRFIYLTDTHIGANPIGFHQQPAYPEYAAEIAAALDREALKQKADFIIHGGDLIDSCCKESIQKAYELFCLSVPVYLCLGNHDLDHPDALRHWLQDAPRLFPGGKPEFELVTEVCRIHVMPNHWEEGRRYHWHKAQLPYFSEEQWLWLEAGLQQEPDKIHLLITHSPVFGMSREQSGLDRIIHDVPDDFQRSLVELVRRFPNLKAVFSGHNHLNTLTCESGAAFVTASSLVETPFEYKLIEVTETSLKMSTHSLGLPSLNGQAPQYNEQKAYAQGRLQDRQFEFHYNG
ncbi:metallophosphoesterase family protein [Paenibacillus senegalensis]|uniref:metallophosphoesterase family protein n=1 Tax=Paenibacillus senegalensis TaxID=1465766 RepID=UPI000289710B|nr:metallophosphoesterase [Paenibacillus senegalensis]